MKNIYTKLCLSAIGCLMMASCDFLDVVPQGTATVDDIYRTQRQQRRTQVPGQAGDGDC